MIVASLVPTPIEDLARGIRHMIVKVFRRWTGGIPIPALAMPLLVPVGRLVAQAMTIILMRKSDPRPESNLILSLRGRV